MNKNGQDNEKAGELLNLSRNKLLTGFYHLNWGW
jgi:hypothetical protein